MSPEVADIFILLARVIALEVSSGIRYGVDPVLSDPINAALTPGA
jgi:hypothetical protein